MQIYCDESGVLSKGIFLATSAMISSHAANHLIARFRKQFKIRGEVKGTNLSPEQRAEFFKALAALEELRSVSVVCDRRTPSGGWASSTWPEEAIYERLLCQSCEALPCEGLNAISVTPDGSRYKKAKLMDIGGRIEVRLGERFQLKAKVSFADSARTAGIQVADVIANTVHAALRDNGQSESLLLTPLIGSGRLSVTDLKLGTQPNWIWRP